jgi:hypothetical protein
MAVAKSYYRQSLELVLGRFLSRRCRIPDPIAHSRASHCLEKQLRLRGTGGQSSKRVSVVGLCNSHGGWTC